MIKSIFPLFFSLSSIKYIAERATTAIESRNVRLHLLRRNQQCMTRHHFDILQINRDREIDGHVSMKWKEDDGDDDEEKLC